MRAPTSSRWTRSARNKVGEVVNLRAARKRRRRADHEVQAQQNRVRHGRTGAQKAAERAERRRGERDHDGRRLERDEPPG